MQNAEYNTQKREFRTEGLQTEDRRPKTDSSPMKRIIVTGATSGIGEEVAHQLGRAGTALVLGCRDVGKGERVAARILDEGGTTDVVVLPLDAASQTSIQDFSRAYRQRFDRLDVLVNNAGLGH